MKAKGFTIVELLIAIVVIAILAAITIVTFNGINTRAKNTAITASVSQSIKQLEVLKVDSSTYPVENHLKAQLDGGLQAGITGYGNYRVLTTHIANIEDVKEIMKAHNLQPDNLGLLTYDEKYDGRVIQGASTDGFFSESASLDYRAASYLSSATTFEDKLNAYDRYQKEVLGYTTVPRVYNSSNVYIGTAATGPSRDISKKRAYPFMQLESQCHTTTKQCFTSLSHYSFGTDNCPSLGVETKKKGATLYNSTSGTATSHGMSFCTSYLDRTRPSNYPN